MASPGGDHGAQEQQADFHFSGSSSTSRDCEAMEATSVPMGLLQKITNNFSEELLLGQGGYGKVYKGVCDDGQEIAVKLLYNNKQTVDDAQFKREFKNLMVLKHPNIVRFVGYCYETQHQHFRNLQGGFDFYESTHKALCFEYMPMGSLQKHLSDEFNGLNWERRYKIIKGACEGLKYLHEGLKTPICHLDLKPDNILLDKNMDPKLADFGLSKFYGREQTWITESPVTGTLGYMPPEYLFHKVVSKKFDIFSLGAVMIKIIAGPSDHDTSSAEMKQEFLDQVQRNWRKSLQTTLTSLEPLEAQCQQVKTCTEIALSCMETDRDKRPSIEDIIRDLNETEIFIENVNVCEQDPSLPPASSSNVFLIALGLLEKITDNFSQERVLGLGTHGKAYMGVYDDGRQIAVKLLYNNMETIDDKQFIREFGNLMMLKHPNIVQVVGYCYETQRQHAEPEGRDVFAETTHKALCFEYMPNGSLQKHMSDECYGLDWQTRYKIIKGTCEGLKYLHEGLENPFYHLDLKPDNILLDENMAPKLADYGLSKFYIEEQIGTTQRHVGTLGYIPPEYINESIVSEKFDIFSLGIVMAKIITGPSGCTRYVEMQHQEYLDQVHENWRKRLKETWSSPEPLEAHCQQVKICTKIALSCMETDRHKRPSIGDIIDELNKTENFMKTVTYYEQEPSPPPASTSNVVQPVATTPPSTPSPPPSPTPYYIGSSTPRRRPPPPPPPPPPPSGGFTGFFRTIFQGKRRLNGACPLSISFLKYSYVLFEIGEYLPKNYHIWNFCPTKIPLP